MAAMMRRSNDPVVARSGGRTSPDAARTLLLGIGNTLLSDDGVGIRIVEHLRLEPAAAASMMLDGGTMSFSLLTYLDGAQSLVAVDAADLKTTAGTVEVFEGAAMDRFIRRHRGRSVHEIGLADLCDMALLHECLPPQRALVCVQPQVIDWGESLSPAVESALPRAMAEVRMLLHRWAA
jgi:hydrogenase maturation protease